MQPFDNDVEESILKYKFLPLVVLAVALAGCNGNDNNKEEKVNIVEALKCSNAGIGSICPENSMVWNRNFIFEDGSPVPDDENLMLTRFDVEKNGLIPVYIQGANDKRFTYAMDKIEEVVGYKLFERKGLINLQFDRSDSKIDYSSLDDNYGFIFSQGTTQSPPSGDCSNGEVSYRPYSYGITTELVDTNFTIVGIKNSDESRFTWISLDNVDENGNMQCSASNDVAVHEVAHALGMWTHFPGFGNGAVINSTALNVLRTMYSPSNPPGQPFDSIQVME